MKAESSGEDCSQGMLGTVGFLTTTRAFSGLSVSVSEVHPLLAFCLKEVGHGINGSEAHGGCSDCQPSCWGLPNSRPVLSTLPSVHAAETLAVLEPTEHLAILSRFTDRLWLWDLHTGRTINNQTYKAVPKPLTRLENVPPALAAVISTLCKPPGNQGSGQQAWGLGK